MTVSPSAVAPRSYVLGDIIDVAIDVEFIDDNRDLTDPPEGELTAALVAPTGEHVDLAVTDEEGETVTVTAAAVTLNVAGIWLVTFTEAGGGTLPALPLVVDDPDTGWHTLHSARRVDWPDAPSDDATLYELLQSARESCLAYAPPLPAGAPVPPRWRQAQLKVARIIWADLQAGGGDVIGPDGITTRVYPLDLHVKQLLRPKQGRPRIR